MVGSTLDGESEQGILVGCGVGMGIHVIPVTLNQISFYEIILKF